MAASAEKIGDTTTALVQWDHLFAWAKATQPAPLLLSSTSDELLGRVSHELVGAMLCEKNTATTFTPACGACRSCRLLQSGNHPDNLRLTTTRATWSIKDMKQMFQAMTLTPTGHRRVITIEAIEKVSLPAANALLKSLEEPRSATSFILTTRWPTRLLPTILSRCTPIHLRASPTIPSPTQPSIDVSQLSADDLDAATLDLLATQLQEALLRSGPTPALKRAYARLRDYYFIKGRRGNTKLAGDVLLLSLPLHNGMS